MFFTEAWIENKVIFIGHSRYNVREFLVALLWKECRVMEPNKGLEICCVCGRDVTRGSGLFANRVPECNDSQTRIEIGRKFPQGEWVCVICDNTDSDEVVHNIEEIIFSMRYEQEILRLLSCFPKS